MAFTSPLQTTKLFYIQMRDLPASTTSIAAISEIHELNGLFQEGWKVKSAHYEQKAAFLVLEKA